MIASAQGTKNGGTAQTQVQGTYSGSGSFSASAQTADKERSAQAQVDKNIHILVYLKYSLSNYKCSKNYNLIKRLLQIRCQAIKMVH